MSYSSKILKTARKKLERSTEHLRRFSDFFEERTDLGFYFDLDYDADSKPFAILKFDEIPEDASIICGEFAHQARSALDVAFVQIAQSYGSKKPRLSFPFATHSSHLTSPNKIQCQNLAELPEAIRKIIVDAAPYEGQGGNHNLTSLNEICNFDKHNDLISATTNGLNITGMAHHRLNNDAEGFVVATMLGTMAGSAFEKGEKLYRNGFRFKIPEKLLDFYPAEQIVRITGRGTRLPYNVVFYNTKTLDDRNVLNACTAMRDEVATIFDNFDKALLF